MAKELPYFKFEPNAWENGNIQLCSRESKGLFIEICSIYWSRLGELPYALALQKLCNGNNVALQELENNQIFTLNEGQIVIEFLDEQLNEFQNTSEKRRKAANKRWNDANALQVQSKSNAIREDKIIEEEIINTPTASFSFFAALAKLTDNKQLINDWLKVRKTKRAANTETALKRFLVEVEKSNLSITQVLEICCEKSWISFKADWVKTNNSQVSQVNKIYNQKLIQ